MIILEINFPPSVNTYWGFQGSRRFLTKKAQEFKQSTWLAWHKSGQKRMGCARLTVEFLLYPPDKKVRDIDNCIKSTLDALCQAGIFDDDGQIDCLLVKRMEQIKGGRAIVKINAL